MMPPNEAASTSEGPHAITLTVNGHSDEETNKNRSNHIELQSHRTEASLNQVEERLPAGNQSHGFWSSLKLFFQMICANGSKSVMLLLFGVICAVLSGCCLSSTIVFTGRIKHVLLTHEARTELFRIRTYEQVYVLASLTVFAIVANFCLQMASSFFGKKLVTTLRGKYASVAEKISTNRHLQNDINNELYEKIQHIRDGSENLELLCRSAGIFIASSFISFYHEFRLTFVLLAVIPICTAIHFLSEKLSRLFNDIRRGKTARASHIEKELLLLNGIDQQSSSDERLVRLSDELYSATRYGIIKEAWDGCYSGIICFIVFTAVGCGMLYGGYLLEMNIMVRQGDIFIVVLSMALLANITGAITSQWRAFANGVNAVIYIKNLEDFMIDKRHSTSFQKILDSSEITVNNILPQKGKAITASEVSPKYAYSKSNNKISLFTKGTNKVLKNYHHDRLYLAVGLVCAALHGLELPAYNAIMGRVFLAMLEPRVNMMHKLLDTMIMFACTGFLILIIRTASGILSGIASEHISVSFRINLVRHQTRPGTTYNKLDVEELVNDHNSKVMSAKSFYHPYASQIISHMTSALANVILGFAFSWEVALLGILFTLFCLIVQLKIGYSMGKDKNIKSTPKNSKDEKSGDGESEIAGNTLVAINFCVIETSGFAIQTVCYALTAYIVNNGYKYPNEAFMSVITLYGALQHIILLPALFKLLTESYSSVHHIFTLMFLRPSTAKCAVSPA